jgi:ABC-type Fe3+/spermidine/putrescine transport system ATPase subunit
VLDPPKETLVPPPHPTTTGSSAPVIRVSRVAVTFGQTSVLRDVTMDVHRGETLVVLGDSGCGKTTLLKVIAGLQAPDEGNVWVEGVELGEIAPQQRGVVYLDQEALLFEHLNVFENIAFAMRLRKAPQCEVNQTVGEMLSAIGLDDHAQKRSWQLSGGQKQRIAFARAILSKPRVLLLDEPLGSLDSRTRGEMQQLYRQLAARFRFTAVLVTHDVREALVLGDRYSLMSNGRLLHYSNRSEFVGDHSTGIQEEIRFWRQVE